MKFTWTEADLKPAGRIIYLQKPEDPTVYTNDDVTLTASRTYILGYNHANTDVPNNRCLISICDGSVICVKPPDKMVELLNLHEYAPMPFPLYLKVIASLRDRIEGHG